MIITVRLSQTLGSFVLKIGLQNLSIENQIAMIEIESYSFIIPSILIDLNYLISYPAKPFNFIFNVMCWYIEMTLYVWVKQDEHQASCFFSSVLTFPRALVTLTRICWALLTISALFWIKTGILWNWRYEQSRHRMYDYSWGAHQDPSNYEQRIF